MQQIRSHDHFNSVTADAPVRPRQAASTQITAHFTTCPYTEILLQIVFPRSGLVRSGYTRSVWFTSTSRLNHGSRGKNYLYIDLKVSSEFIYLILSSVICCIELMFFFRLLKGF